MAASPVSCSCVTPSLPSSTSRSLRFALTGYPLHTCNWGITDQLANNVTQQRQHDKRPTADIERQVAHTHGILYVMDWMQIFPHHSREVEYGEMDEQDLLRNIRDYPLASAPDTNYYTTFTVERAPVDANANSQTQQEAAMLATDDALLPIEQEAEKHVIQRFHAIMERRRKRALNEQDTKQPFTRIHPDLDSPDGPAGRFCALGCFDPALVATDHTDAILLGSVSFTPHVCPTFESCSCLLTMPSLSHDAAVQALDEIIITHNTWRVLFVYPFARETVISYESSSGHGFTRRDAIRLLCNTFCTLSSDMTLMMAAQHKLRQQLDMYPGRCPYYHLDATSQSLSRVRVVSIYAPRIGVGQPQRGDGRIPPDGVIRYEYDDDFNIRLEPDENLIYQVRYLVVDEENSTPKTTP